MRNVNVAICDDDLFFARELKTKIENVLLNSNSEVSFIIDIFTSAQELLTQFSSKYSVCFMDICINEENGITTGIKLKQLFPDTILVFVTSFIDFSLDGYKADAFRYVLKDSIDNVLPDCIMDIIHKISLNIATISINIHGKNVDVKASAVTYIESFLHNQIVHMSDGRSIECSMTLSDFEKQIKNISFTKSHKSFLVNLKYINKIEKYDISLSDGTHIPIAKNKYTDFKIAYLKYLADV